MTKDKALEVVKQAVLETDPALDINNITMSANLRHDFGFDSLDVVETAVNIEKHLNFEIDEGMDLDKVTVKDLVELVEKQ